MRRWSEIATRIAATTRTSEKVATLADYLSSLTPAELPIAVTYMTGRPFPERDPRTTGIGWAAIAGVVEALVDARQGALGASYNQSSDLGQAVADLLTSHGHEPSGTPPTLPDVDAAFSAIAAAKGAAKAKPLRDLLARCDAESAKYVVKALSGDLRIGLREGHLEAAIAKAFGRPLEDVQWTGMLTGDLGQTALLARDDRLGDAELALFRPLKSMLASPVADEAEVLQRLGSPVWVEDKYDGIRCQLHKQGREVRLYSGDLRIGLREGHLEAAIAKAFGRPLEDVQWTGMLTGDLGQTALLARDDRLGDAELALFRPLKSMLASPVADEAEVLERLGSPVWVEDKYDGIRCQLHKQGREVRLYSRDLHDVSDSYPEVVASAATAPWDGILDGELLAFRDGMALPFLQLQARLGRKSPTEQMQREIPVIYVAFDVLALRTGRARKIEPLLRLGLRQRRARLDALNLPDVPGMATSNELTAATAQQLAAIFDESQARGNEGLMVKDPDSIYSPGRRGYGWMKLKRPLATLDCVVVGVEVGHGKRHGVLSDYTFAVIDDRPGAEGRLVTIGKAYSGLTDKEIATMTTWFEAHTIQRVGRFHVVEPTVVVEIAFDVIHRSNRHESGFALRFPRIFRLRDDKDAREIDTLSNVETLYKRLESGRRFSVQTKAGAAPPA